MRFGSISRATTCPARAARSSVIAPRPAPISQTRSSCPTAKAATMRCWNRWSWRKCCPSFGRITGKIVPQVGCVFALPDPLGLTLMWRGHFGRHRARGRCRCHEGWSQCRDAALHFVGRKGYTDLGERTKWAKAHFFVSRESSRRVPPTDSQRERTATGSAMQVDLEKITEMARRVAVSEGLSLVDVELKG